MLEGECAVYEGWELVLQAGVVDGCGERWDEVGEWRYCIDLGIRDCDFVYTTAAAALQ